MNTTSETVTIKGVIYEVLGIDTPDSHEAKGLVRLAKAMREHKIARALHITRLNGSKLFHVVQFESGAFGTVKSMLVHLSEADKDEFRANMRAAQ